MQATLNCLKKYSEVLAVGFKLILTNLFLDSYQKFIVQIFAALTDILIVRNAYPGSIYLLKVSNRNTRKRCEMCSKLTIKTPERRQLKPAT